MANTDNQITILCYGDSNTYGYNPENNGRRYKKSERWTMRLEEKLGKGYCIVEEGLNGRTTAYDRPNGAFKNGLTPLAAILGSHIPIDILIFMLGTNDCNIEMLLKKEDIAAGMEKLVVQAKKTCEDLQGYIPEIILIAPAAIREELAGTPFEDQLDRSSVKKSREIAALYENIAEKHKCRFLNACDKLEVSKTDCEHLTLNGHSRLADMIYELITLR